MREKRSFFLGTGLLALIFVLAIIPTPVSAALVWSEYFEELDFDTWTAQSCQLIDNELHGINGDHISAVHAYRESTVAVGTWKFDLREVGGWGEELDTCRVTFLSPLEPEVPDWEYIALSIVHGSNTQGVRLIYRIEKYMNNQPKIILGTHLGEIVDNTAGTLNHFGITRTAGGLITVYLNNTQIIQVTDTDITETNWFDYYTWDDWAFDNIEVYDTIEIGQPLTLLSIGLVGGGAIAIVVIAVYFMKIRK